MTKKTTVEPKIAKTAKTTKTTKPAKPAKEPKKDGLKRPPNAYMIYSNKVRATMKAANPTASMTDLTRIIASAYKTLPETERATYNAEAAKLSAEYKAAKSKQ